MITKNMALGIDIGGTNTKIGLITNSGNLILDLKIPTNKEILPENFIHYLYLEVFKNLSQKFNSPEQYLPFLKGIGVGAPMANFESGRIDFAPNLGWKDVPLKSLFEKIFKLPTFIENDANLAALGEKRWGAGINLNHFILVTLGTGVGTGLILDGKLYRGNHALGAEGGHVLIPHHKSRVCSCGGTNHLESFLSAKGIKETILEITKENWSIEELGQKFSQNNAFAEEVLNVISEELARGLETMSVLLAPEAFIIGGGVSKLGLKFDRLVEKKLNNIIHYSLKDKIKVIPSSLSGEMGAIFGGAALLFQELRN
jgi:glucokinase